MKIARHFTTAGQDPFATVAWTKRSSKISNPDGSIVFKMDDAEVPETWSQLATDIMVSKYFRKAGIPQFDEAGKALTTREGKPVTGPEKSARQVIHRLAGCWRHWGEANGYFDTTDDAQAFYDELAYMLTHQVAAPNSPQWFNTGLNWAYGITGPAQGHFVADHKTGAVDLAKDAYTHPQPHACFIQSVKDDLVNEGGIMDLWTREARLFKYGSGTGTNFSGLRGENESLSGGGKSSGLMSWLRIGDRAAGAIKSGGTTRRAAKMVCLNMDHPDIMDFVNWKVREEIKVQAMVEGFKAIKDRKNHPSEGETIGQTAERMKLKLDYDFNGESYSTVSGQNSNNSVRIPDAFFDALDAGAQWQTKYRITGKPAKSFAADELWRDIGYAAWRCADPGVQFDTTINAWHTCPSAGAINASNPCVTGDTLIATTGGLKRIGQLVGQSVEVIDGQGKPSLVTQVFKTGTKPVFTLRTKSGYSIRVTADHKIQTANRGDVAAAELTVDDRVILKGAGFGLDFLPAQAAELIGAAVGDGCITRGDDQDHVFISMGHNEADVGEHLRANMDWCKGWLADAASKPDARGTRPTTVHETATGLRVGTSIDAMVALMSQYALLDGGSKEKAFTDLALGLDQASQSAMLRGLFTADGTVANYGDKSQYVAVDSVSLPLLRQVQLMMLSMGIKAKIYENRRVASVDGTALTAQLPDGKGGTATYPVEQMHSLRISRSSRVVFEKLIGFLPGSHKAAKLAELNARVGAYADEMFDNVASLTPAGVEDVFDLTEPQTHHFVAGGMVVHNCSEYMFLDNTACNLASINLIKLYDPVTRKFDIAKYEHAIDLWTMVLEISVVMAAFPSREIAELSWKYRTLGLGFANLGALLMQGGLGYDSQEARALAACFSSILTGRAYRASALMAKEHGAFPGYGDDRENMLRVIRNHRLAAHGVARDSDRYEQLRIRPVPIHHATIKSGKCLVYNATEMLEHATEAWDEALEYGITHGYRNAQTTVIAPTGTIGLLMDCDTTGVEPDFALVKFKKLAGGGYFKIANASVKPALEALGYSDAQIKDILTYLLGALTVDTLIPSEDGGSTGGTLKGLLEAKGFSAADIAAVNSQLPGVFELKFAFASWTVGDALLAKLGIDAATAKADHSFNLLKVLGLSGKQIDLLNDTICGRLTVEGSPHLKLDDYPVFDCANACGKHGTRYIAPEGHIRMMAAVQPFVSGAISKTINLPTHATVADCQNAYRLSWELGIKANALYRDGCKLSQPLSTKSEDSGESTLVELKSVERIVYKEVEKVVERVVERPMRRRLPDTRASITHKFNVAGHEGYLTVGLYEDGQPGELFITMAKEGSTIGGLMDAIGTATSVALQYGVPVVSLVNKFTHQRFEPAGMTMNPDIPIAKSLVDYIFRWMGMQFIPGYREANSPRREASDYPPAEPVTVTVQNLHALNTLAGIGDRPPAADPQQTSEDLSTRHTKRLFEPETNGSNGSSGAGGAAGGLGGMGGMAQASHVHVHKTVTTTDFEMNVSTGAVATASKSALQMALEVSGDGAPCEKCGTITVRNGACYKCLNCGHSGGCG